ncbi:MAG: TolC family protein, partial [Calditrichia bacterium]|nr:TolC family protein [Calditrichia bacterium]
MINNFSKLLVIVLFFINANNQVAIAKEDKEFNIGVVFDGPSQLNNVVLNMVKHEIDELTEAEFYISFPDNKIVDGGWNADKIKSLIDNLLSDSEVDFIITLGAIASDNIAKRGDLPKPVIAPFIVDPKIQGIPVKKGKSGLKNLNYIVVPFTTPNTLKDFLGLGEFKNLAILYNKNYLDAIPALEQRTKKIAEKIGINTFLFKIEKSIDEVFKDFPAEIEAVYVSPLLHLPETDFTKLVDELKKRKLPSFSIMGTEDVKRGILATNRPNIFPRIARRIALNIQRILLGEKPHKIDVYFAPGEQLAINMKTAREINVYPKWSVLTEADLIGEEETETGRALDLNAVVNEAVKENLDVLAQKRNLSATAENIAIARSNLLPQLGLSAIGIMIDKDRAKASFGSQPERTVTGSITATQLIYSEAAWANLSIQNWLQESREFELEMLKLDISLSAAKAFLNVLRAKTFEKIQKQNLKRTKSNLEVARVRESVGSAGPAEVYRWESELATNRNSVIQAIAQSNLARIELNRLLHRNLEEQFICIEENVYSENLMNSTNTLPKYLGNPYAFGIFKDFMVKEGLKNSPELASLNAAIQAQERALISATKKYWMPTLALQAEYSNILSKDGAGSETVSFSPGFPETDDTNWNMALNLSFPLFDGTSKYAERRKASKELEQLSLQYDAISEKIEQRIRSSLYKVGASFAAIRELKLSAEAAAKSLKVVKDAYARGAVSILDLLDAQNVALVSEELASNAVFDFTIDLMTVERAVGKYYLQLSE